MKIKTTGKTNREEDKEGQSERRGREGKANAEGAGEKQRRGRDGRSKATLLDGWLELEAHGEMELAASGGLGLVLRMVAAWQHWNLPKVMVR